MRHSSFVLPSQSLLSQQQITYSPAYTLVPTYECFNRCTYCNFRVDPGQDAWLTLADAEQRLHSLAGRGIIEILLLSGEVHPSSPRRSGWFEHLYQLCELALNHGFLPHTNAGPLSHPEMERLRSVNVSMGLMLEQLSPKLLETVHRHAPSKEPNLRLQQLEWAGELQIPFTTGLLLGLGETEADRRTTLEAIATVHRRWGHIQEVILQPHSPGERQTWEGEAFSAEDLAKVVAIATQILPPDITIQVPPNLIETPNILINCLKAGARDLGGIVPRDEVNPDYHHLSLEQLSATLQTAGYELTPRLPVYPHHESWLAPRLQAAVQQHRGQITKPVTSDRVSDAAPL
ncbi:FO synthase [Acaryochloris thomasi RCC1774]|uniref:7,8-didemethyl-8-hydroxy-5-deazariboflavin synthase n=1 Tax=Acaryochloris thomasi RCC1774 TaxID=1764569 RepID=A0A2W1JUS8_9CYAN|nr:7,8-didemethyl-8-hydroxy-5-deazariboflavin synthase subunit CofG [Acaryochloris thomasi]PZD72561.1 FO synthase [Acaryochloris thomasi RCC1774]